jgi:hypothetical protein
MGVAIIFWLARLQALPEWPLPLWMVGALAACIMAFELLGFWVSTPPYRFCDFLSAYYPAGQAMVHNDHAALRALTSQRVVTFVNIPVVAYLFAPFGIFGRHAAIALFTLTGVGFAVGSWFLLLRMLRLDLKARWLLMLLFLASGPLMNTIKLGNTSEMILLALTAGLMLIRAGRSVAAGAVLGVAAVIKLPLILTGLFFMFRRDWWGVAGFSAVGIMTALLSLALFGWSDNLHWVQTCVVQFNQKWLPTFNVQSVAAFVMRLDTNARLSDWVPQVPTPSQKLLAHLFTGLIFLVAALACVRLPTIMGAMNETDASSRRDLQYLLVICLCLVSSPLSWSHYYLWLLIPTAFLLEGRLPLFNSQTARRVGWVAIALVTPLVGWPWSIPNPLLMTVYRTIIMSHLFLGGLIWFGLIAYSLARTGGLLSSADGVRSGHSRPGDEANAEADHDSADNLQDVNGLPQEHEA